MMNIIRKRTLWTLAKGKTIGVIESSYKKGFFIHGDYISFRQTNSALVPSEPKDFNTHFLTPEYKKLIDDILSKKEIVYIHFNVELFNDPAQGDFLEETYITHIEIPSCNRSSVEDGVMSS